MTQKDLKSRQVLSELLDEQLSRNEELSEDNLKLEAEQLAAAQELEQRVKKEHFREIEEWEEQVHQLKMANS